jgi:hypothetical protein
VTGMECCSELKRWEGAGGIWQTLEMNLNISECDRSHWGVLRIMICYLCFESCVPIYRYG